MWQSKDNSLKRKFKFKDFSSALAFVNKVGEIAETENHHPDISLGWGYVEITLTTHSEGRVTAKDKAMAELIDRLQSPKEYIA